VDLWKEPIGLFGYYECIPSPVTPAEAEAIARDVKQIIMFALGVIPEYHGRGIDSLIYHALYESLYTPDVWIEINYVLEDNVPMNSAIKKLDAKPLRRYRIYQREI
jgi:GNAT superfamily N-acetyltransferase